MRFRKPRPGSPEYEAEQRPFRARFWAFFCFRNCVRMGVVALLVLLALLLLVWFTPWRLRQLDRWVSATVTEATGLGLDFGSATLRLSHGRVTVTQLVLVDPLSGETLLKLDRVAVELNPLELLVGKAPYPVRDVEIDGALEIDLIREDEQWRLGRPWPRLRELIEAHRAARSAPTPGATPAPPTQSMPFALRHLEMGPVAFRVLERGDRGEQTLMRIEAAQLGAQFDAAGRPQQIILNGRLNGRDDGDNLRLAVRPAPDLERFDLRLRLPDFDTFRDVPHVAGLNVHAEQLDLAGELLRTPDRPIRMDLRLAADDVVLRGLPRIDDQRLGQTELILRAEWATDARRLDLTSATLRAEPLSLRMAGHLELAPQPRYSLELEAARFEPPGVRALGAYLDQRQWPLVVHPQRSRIELDAKLAGPLDAAPERLSGRLRLAHLDCPQLPDLPVPVNDIALQARLTSQGLTLTDAAARMHGIPVRLEGHVDGDLLAGRIRGGRVTWHTTGELAELTDLVNFYERASGPRIEVSGQVAGSGVITLEGPVALEAAPLLRAVRYRGQVDFSQARMKHPDLPAALRELDGTVHLSEQLVRVEELTGRIGGMDFELSGQVSDVDAWDRLPFGNLQARLSGELPAALELIRAHLRARGREAVTRAWPRATGRMELDLNLTRDEERGKDSSIDGRLAIHDLLTTLSAPQVRGAVAFEHVVLAFDPQRVRLSQTRGSWGDLTVAADAEIRPDRGEATLQFDGPLIGFARGVREIERNFRLDGTVQSTHHVTIATTGPAAAYKAWADWLTELRHTPPTADNAADWLARRFDYEVDGRLELQDAELTFYAMPTHIRKVTGVVTYDERRLTTPDWLTVDPGPGSRGMLGKLDLTYNRPGQPVRFEFDITGERFVLSNWVQSWNYRPEDQSVYVPGIEVDPTRPKAFELRGRFKADVCAFGGVEAENFIGFLDYDAYDEPPHTLVWHDVTGDVCDGTMALRGHLINWELRNTFEAHDVDVRPFYTAVSEERDPGKMFTGAMTGDLTIQQQYGRETPQPMTGEGHIRVDNSEFVSSQLFNAFWGLLDLPLFGTVNYSTIEGPFSFEGGQVRTDGLTVNNPLMNVRVSGTIGPDWKLNLDLQLEFLQFASGVPLVGQALGLFNRLAGSVLRFRVSGTFDEPRAYPLGPLSDSALSETADGRTRSPDIITTQPQSP